MAVVCTVSDPHLTDQNIEDIPLVTEVPLYAGTVLDQPAESEPAALGHDGIGAGFGTVILVYLGRSCHKRPYLHPGLVGL